MPNVGISNGGKTVGTNPVTLLLQEMALVNRNLALFEDRLVRTLNYYRLAFCLCLMFSIN